MAHTPRNLILNQGCSQVCNNNENIHVDNNKRVHHQGDLVKFQVFFSIYIVDVLHRLVYYFE